MAEAEQKAYDETTLKTDEASATINHHGAHVTSWKVGNDEVMFLSKNAVQDGSIPIRGGVPLIFPQFGPGPMRQHGFARRVKWTLLEKQEGKDEAMAKFELKPNEFTLNMWKDVQFYLTFTVKISGKKMMLDFNVLNTNKQPIKFTCAFHTYFNCDINTVQVKGLKGCMYRDSLDEYKMKKEEDEFVKFGENVDRVYRDVTWPVTYNMSGNKTVSIESNVNDCVVWNPWSEKAKAMKDFADDEYLNMVCVEPGNCIEGVDLKEGDNWSFTKTMTLTEG